MNQKAEDAPEGPVVSCVSMHKSSTSIVPAAVPALGAHTHTLRWGSEGKGGKKVEGSLRFIFTQWTTFVPIRLPSILLQMDISKIDCEGCEWTTYTKWFDGKTTIRQIQIEVHAGTEGEAPVSAQSFMLFLKSKGYVIFHKEANIMGCQGKCIEYAFLLLNL